MKTKKSFWEYLPDYLMAICTAGIFTVTFFYTRYAGSQLVTMNNQSQDIHLQTRAAIQAARAAKSAADTAAETLRHQKLAEASTDRQFSQQLQRLDFSIRAQLRLARAAEDTSRVNQNSYNEARLERSINQANLAVEERPWISVSVPSIATSGANNIDAQINIANYGRSPAMHVTTIAEFAAGTDAFQRTAKFFDMYPRTNLGSPSLTVLPPGIGSPPTITQTARVGPLQPPARDTLLKADGELVVGGRVTYSDLRGHHYHTDYCVYHLAAGGVAYCNSHNEMK